MKLGLGAGLAERSGDGPPWFGMGTVTTAARAREAVAAGAEFFVTPNVSAAVAHEARQADLFLVIGALTATEIVTAHELGAIPADIPLRGVIHAAGVRTVSNHTRSATIRILARPSSWRAKTQASRMTLETRYEPFVSTK